MTADGYRWAMFLWCSGISRFVLLAEYLPPVLRQAMIKGPWLSCKGGPPIRIRNQILADP